MPRWFSAAASFGASASSIARRRSLLLSVDDARSSMAEELKSQSAQGTEIKEQALPVLPVRDTVLFPHAVLPLTVGRESSVNLINSLGEEKTIIVVAQREARIDAPQPSDLYHVGTLAVVHKVVKMPNQSLFVFAEGLDRIELR